jgi:uroporphyrinogen decarboxylase
VHCSAIVRAMNELFLAECAGKNADRRPVWMMRQAGRILPEYREIRARVSFLELCKTPELAAQVTLQPVDILGVDAAIVFADILLPLEAMGAELRFEKGDGPRFSDPVRSRSDMARLGAPDVGSKLGYVFETLRLVRSQLAGRVPLIGFAGSPWTLACYLVEGGASSSFPYLLAWSYRDPEGLAELLSRLADISIDYLLAQVEAGAQALQIFDTWGGALGRDRWQSIALPPLLRILEALPAEVPKIFYMRNSWHLIDVLGDLPVEVLSVDWRLPLDEIRRRLGPSQKVLQGNLDPGALLGPKEAIPSLVQELLRAGRGGGHIVNLGHGVLPTTPVENARAFIDAVKNASRES